MATKASSIINSYMNKATFIALDEIERIARELLNKHDNLDEFIMAMGTFFLPIKTRAINCKPIQANIMAVPM